MINNLTTSSAHLVSSPYTTPYIGNNGQSAGSMRFNTVMQQIEVFDGISWIAISQHVSVGMTWTAEEAIRWAQTKMEEERDLKARMERHPGLKDAWEKFQLMDLLTREEDEQPAQS